SAYSMPLCTILTKWPVPSGPTCTQQGVPSTVAAIDSNIGPSVWYDCVDPPGMMLGPFNAPSSPPETPVPTKCKPCARKASSRRRVSRKCALPQSMTMSSLSSNGTSSSITASVGAPALTMMMIARGRCSEATKSSIESLGTKVPSDPCCATSSCVLALVRLCNATRYPCRARLRARLRPITASPVTPICACPVLGWLIALPYGAAARFDPVTCWRGAACLLGTVRCVPVLLVVHHTSSPSLQAMLEAVLAGAGTDEIENVEVVVRPALAATAVDVLGADGFVF